MGRIGGHTGELPGNTHYRQRTIYASLSLQKWHVWLPDRTLSGLWVSAIIYPYLKGEIASSFPFRVTHCYQHPAKEALGSYTCHFSPLEDQTYGLHCFFSPYLGKSRRQPWITQAPVLPTGICFLPWSRIVPHMWLSNQKESFLVAVLLGLPSPTCVKVGYCEYFYTLSCVLF